MSVLSVCCIGIMVVLFAIQLKGIKSEFGIYLTLAACLLIIGCAVSHLQNVKDFIVIAKGYMQNNSKYLSMLLRIIGITYICQFSSDICTDCGYVSIARQIEMFCKLVILSYSVPVVISVLENVEKFI